MYTMYYFLFIHIINNITIFILFHFLYVFTFVLFQVINFDSPRGGISLVTEKGRLTTSRLLVQKAIQSDSGLYTCAPSNANPISVRVHILNGKFSLSFQIQMGLFVVIVNKI